ncbi:hypothetical protein E5288_WYG006042 [Bos mutus]|uniref:Uncharacterized protein n=1 Tax=Bos mutus TaxID=72004 RepID=A0A6B0QW27_9CETA|nr:hypothetical protein [Bos mutus]
MQSSMDDLSETAPVAACWVPPKSFRDFRFLTPVLKLPHWKEDGGHTETASFQPESEWRGRKERDEKGEMLLETIVSRVLSPLSFNLPESIEQQPWMDYIISVNFLGFLSGSHAIMDQVFGPPTHRARGWIPGIQSGQEFQNVDALQDFTKGTVLAVITGGKPGNGDQSETYSPDERLR